MADIVDKKTRSLIMSRIRGKDTKPEVLIRKKMFAHGLRYRLHNRKLPGKPDMVFPKYNAVIFFNGCFWHVHDCDLFKWPSTRKEFWEKKLKGNKNKDQENIEALRKIGCRILIIWECAYRSTSKKDWDKIDGIAEKAIKWLNSKSNFREIHGGIVTYIR